jgi:hypothetical protein
VNVFQLRLTSEKFGNNNNSNNNNKGVILLWNQAVHTDIDVTTNMLDIIIKNKKEKHAH